MIYPQTCYFCGKINKSPICNACKTKMEYVGEPRCAKCGKPIRYAEKEYCEDCKNGEFFFEKGKSIWIHKGPVAWSVYQFKYHNRRVYGEFYAGEMWRLYGKDITRWNIDCIVPIPLHWKRKRSRGYNQAECIARSLGKLSGIPVVSDAIKRIRYTERQKNLDNKERKRNLEGAFRISRKWKKTKSVLLIDDIYTTGSTLNEVAKMLKQSGVEKIWFLTISIGQGF